MRRPAGGYGLAGGDAGWSVTRVDARASMRTVYSMWDDAAIVVSKVVAPAARDPLVAALFGPALNGAGDPCLHKGCT